MDITATLQSAIDSFMNTTGEFLPNIIGAILVLIIGWFIARGLRSLTRTLLGKTDLDNRLFKSTKSNFSPEAMISKLVSN